MLLVRNKSGQEFVVTQEAYDLHKYKLGKQWIILDADYKEKRKEIKKEVKQPIETTTKLKENGKSNIKTSDKTVKQNRSRSKRTDV